MKKVILVVFLAIITSSCIFMPRCHNRQCGVRMEHYHNGYEYRGTSLFKYLFRTRNPRYGDGYPDLVRDPASVEKK